MTGSSINIKELLEDAVENVIDTELDELYDRIELLFNKVNDGISITGSPEIIQKNEYADISVRAVRDGVPLDNKTIYFYEIIRPTLSLTSPTNAIQSGDRCDVSVKVKDEDGSIVDGEIVKFYTVVSEHYTYIGSGETDESGVAHLSIDTAGNSLQSNGYLADGDGNIGIVAKYDDELSQPYSLVDCIYKYDGTDTVNEFYTKYIAQNNLGQANTVTVDSTGTVIETDASKYSTTYMQLTPMNFPTYVDCPLCYEFDLIEASNYTVCTPMQRGSDTWWYSVSDIGHIRIEATPTGFRKYVNGEIVTNNNSDCLKSRWYLQSNNSTGNGHIKFKNLRISQLNSATNTPSTILVSATNPIIQSGESSTITARAIGTDGGVVRHQPIKVYNGNTLIGTMTDNKGVHTYSYTGTGRGAINLKCGNVVSEPYGIIDAKLYLPNEETITFEKTYKYDASASDYQWEYPFCLEFDIKQTQGSGNEFRIRAYQENSSNINALVRDLTTIGISDNEYHHIKWTISQNKVIEQLDDGVEREFTKNFTGNLKVNFTRYNSTNVSATVKNLRIYPI